MCVCVCVCVCGGVGVGVGVGVGARVRACDFACVALLTQYASRMRHIACDVSGSTLFSDIIS